MIQQYVQEAANGASPHFYDALRLTFGNVVGTLKEGRRKAEDEQKAREEAEKQSEKRCPRYGWCGRCNQEWRGEDVCRGCGQIFK